MLSCKLWNVVAWMNLILAARNARRRLRWMRRAYSRGAIDGHTVRQRIAAWLGHAANATSAGLLAKLRPEFDWFEHTPPGAMVHNEAW